MTVYGKGTKCTKVKYRGTGFYKKNPGVEKALEAFDLSYEQYQKAMMNRHFYTDTSTTNKNNLVY